jgi:TP901 family phage tail tape measure protein
MSDLRLGIDADTRQAEAKIAKLADRPLKLNLKDSISQPLGRITGQVSEFNKSLEASNARVLAFGASAGAIFAVQKGLSATIKSAIEVEKSLTDINVVLGISARSLAGFGDSLFKIAKNTGQSFDVVAVAATELARQGLSVEQTLQRTSDALVLTRLSGLDTVRSVEALTAAVNSFSKAGLSSTQIINKFANVDAAFAVSSADLAEAISRVGSTAQDVGVDIDQLIALVTSAQQTTARGGAVIGNSFKTIFTRVQRADTLDALEGVGVAVRDLEGNALPAVQILNNLAGSFKNLSSAQQASIAETVGGVFQINILRAALGDLGKEYSVYDGALKTSVGSTNEAIKRNEALNTTLSALVNKTLVNFNQAAAEIGNIVFAPSAGKSLNVLNDILDAFNQPKETEGVGTKVAKGILGGLGSYLSGPGLAVIGAVFIRLFSGLTVFGAEALKTLLNLSSGSDKIAQSQSRVNAILAQNPQLIESIISKEMSLLQVENQILSIIRQQNAARSVASTITTSIAPRVPAPKKYGGFIPNFADAEIMGARSEGYSAQKSFEVNNPILGKVTVNNREKTNSVGVGDYPPGSFIVNPNQLGQVAGVPLESIERMKHKGFIPNFAKSKAPAVSRGRTADVMTYSDRVSMIYPRKVKKTSAVGYGDAAGKKVGVKFPIAGFDPKLAVHPQDSDLEQTLGGNLIDFTNNFISKVFQPKSSDVEVPKISKIDELSNAGSFKSIVGTVFETAIDYATGHTNADRSQNASIDFMNPSEKLKQLFQGAPGEYEAKNNALGPNLDKTAQKIINNGLLAPSGKKELGDQYAKESAAFRDTELSRAGLKKKRGVTKKGFGGFIPNFAALEEAVKREKSAGIASSMIRVGTNENLTNNNNPMGLGVYNTRDEPSGLNQGLSRKKSKGFVPNFAKGGGIPPILDKSAGKAAGVMENLSSKALAFSITLPIVTGIIQKFGSETSNTAKNISALTGVVSNAATGLSLFAAGGPLGMAIGAIVGAAYGAYEALDNIAKQKKADYLLALKTNAEQAAESLQTFNGQVNGLSSILNELSAAQESGADISKKSLEDLAEKINSLPLSTQAKIQPQLEKGDFSGMMGTIQTESAKKERESRSKSTGESIQKQLVNTDLKKGETVYKTGKDAMGPVQDVLGNLFASMDLTSAQDLSARITAAGSDMEALSDVLNTAADSVGADKTGIEALNLVLAVNTESHKSVAEAAKKVNEQFKQTNATLLKTKGLNFQKDQLTGAGELFGGKESFMNPAERYSPISEMAASASLYAEGSKTGDVDTKGRGGLGVLSSMVKNFNIDPKKISEDNPMFKSAVEARKKQGIEAATKGKEVYMQSLGKDEKADPEMIAQFDSLIEEANATKMAQESIKEYLASDAQKTYIAFAPTLANMLAALQALDMTGGTKEQKDALTQASVNKADEERKLTGKTQKQMFGENVERDAQGSIMPETIDPKSEYAQEYKKTMFPVAPKNETPEQKTKREKEQQEARAKATPLANQVIQQVPAISTNASSSIVPTQPQAVPYGVGADKKAALADTQKNAGDVAKEIFTNMSNALTTFLKDVGSQIDNFLQHPFDSIKKDLADSVETGGTSTTLDAVSKVTPGMSSLPAVPAVAKAGIDVGMNLGKSETFGPLFEKLSNMLMEKTTPPTQAPSEDKLQNPPKGANGSVTGTTTASVNVAPINANINITSNPDTTTQATIAAIQAAIDGMSEKIRVIEGKSGEKTPPSKMAMNA